MGVWTDEIYDTPYESDRPSTDFSYRLQWWLRWNVGTHCKEFDCETCTPVSTTKNSFQSKYDRPQTSCPLLQRLHREVRFSIKCDHPPGRAITFVYLFAKRKKKSEWKGFSWVSRVLTMFHEAHISAERFQLTAPTLPPFCSTLDETSADLLVLLTLMRKNHRKWNLQHLYKRNVALRKAVFLIKNKRGW